MLIYFFILTIPVFLGVAYAGGGKFSQPGFVGYFLLLLVFTGLRDRVGADWDGYINIFLNISEQPIYDFFSESRVSEPGFVLVNYLSDLFGLYVYGVNLICAFIFLFGLFSLAKRTANPWLAVAVVTPFLIYIISMSGVRQAVAIGICFFIVAFSNKLSRIEKLILVALATSFHSSAVIFFAFLVFEYQGNMLLRMFFLLVVSGLVFMAMGESDAIESYQERYLLDNAKSDGAFLHVLLSAFPSFLYLKFSKKIEEAGWGNSYLRIGAYMSILALPLTFVSSTGVSRISLYFSFVQMWIYPALISTFKGATTSLLGFVVLIIFGIFFVYFIFGSHAYLYIPYNNILF